MKRDYENNKQDFLDLVLAWANRSPDMIADINNTYIRGIQVKLDDANTRRADAEWAALMGYEFATNGLKIKKDTSIWNKLSEFVATTYIIGGSKRSKNLLRDLGILKDTDVNN